jgi:hypothetical protein
MTMGPSDASATPVGRRPAFQVNGGDDSERPRYAKTGAAPSNVLCTEIGVQPRVLHDSVVAADVLERKSLRIEPICTPTFSWSTIFSENRFPLFRIML